MIVDPDVRQSALAKLVEYLKSEGLLARARSLEIDGVKIELAPVRPEPEREPVELLDIERARVAKNAELERDLLGRSRTAQRS